MQGNILVIEDVKELADLITLYLSREGFDARAVESAEEGLTTIEAWKPELVILVQQKGTAALPGLRNMWENLWTWSLSTQGSGKTITATLPP